MRSLLMIALACSITGCATDLGMSGDVGSNAITDRPAAASVDVGLGFNWTIIGDGAVRPVQVFTAKGSTYLQMKDSRRVVLMVNGEVIPYYVSAPYLVVQGEPLRIDVVSDGYRAVAEQKRARPNARQSGNGDSDRKIERVSVR